MTCSKCAALSRTCFEYVELDYMRAHGSGLAPIHANLPLYSMNVLCSILRSAFAEYIDWSSGHFDRMKETHTKKL
jgi:hypothetical protein